MSSTRARHGNGGPPVPQPDGMLPTMKRCFLAFAALLFLDLPVAGQSQMKEWLNSGTEKDRVQKLVSLGVERETAELAGGEEVEWRPIRSESHREVAILFLPCGALYAAFLHLLEKTDQGWRVTDSVGFDCHYDESVSFETAPLRSPNFDDVLVHHECEEHGTGFVQQNLNVFAIVSSRFKLILTTEEIIEQMDTSGEFLQRSSFAQIPATEPISRGLAETRCVTLSGKRTVYRRQFRWSAARFRFLRSQFIKVQAGEEKSKAACR